MPTRPVPFSEIQRTVQTFENAVSDGYAPMPRPGASVASALLVAGRELGFSGANAITAVAKRLDTAVALGVQVRSWRAVDSDFANQVLLRYRNLDVEYQDAELRLSRPGAAASAPAARSGKSQAGRSPSGQRAGAPPTFAQVPQAAPGASADLASKIVPLLRRGPLTTAEIAEKLQVDPMTAFAAVFGAHKAGAVVEERGGRWHLDDAPALGINRSDDLGFVTDPDGTFTFAVATDQHLCSKYERLDCLGDFYDEVERRGIAVVLNAGNWIDGEATFNRHDLLVHGMDAQMQYLARNYPKRAGVTTYAITGADHEGWYARREGVDVGRYAENVIREAGRTDWVDIGYMERFVPLKHYSSGKGSPIHVMHPGGGSAYALSYAPQKIVEGYDGGDKPAALIIGHYHKSGYNLIRNVHTMQGGCFQDQTVFMRQKRLSAHVGGCFVKLTVDPRTGAFVECTYTFRNYFVRDYYDGRWSQHGAVNLAERVVKL